MTSDAELADPNKNAETIPAHTNDANSSAALQQTPAAQSQTPPTIQSQTPPTTQSQIPSPQVQIPPAQQPNPPADKQPALPSTSSPVVDLTTPADPATAPAQDPPVFSAAKIQGTNAKSNYCL